MKLVCESLEQFLSEKKITGKAFPDLTRLDRAKKNVGPQLEELIPRLGNMSLEDMKKEFISIIEDPTTYLSDKKANDYKKNVNTITNAAKMRTYITNIYLASANMAVK